MMTQAEREAAHERVRRELGLDRIGTAPDAAPLPPRPSGTPVRPASALPIEAEIRGAQLYEYGEIWGRPGLDLRTRSFITVAVLTAMGQADQLYRQVNCALNLAITPEEIHEALLQVGVYAGLSAWESAVAVAGEVFVVRGILPGSAAGADGTGGSGGNGDSGTGVSVEPKPPMDHEDRRAARNRVVAALGVGRLGLGPQAAPLVPLPGPLTAIEQGRMAIEYDLAMVNADYGYGEVWGRPGLDLRTRSFITVTVLQVMHENDQLHIHLNNALNLGITADEINEALGQAGVYGGGSGWHNAVNVARHVFGQRGFYPQD